MRAATAGTHVAEHVDLECEECVIRSLRAAAAPMARRLSSLATSPSARAVCRHFLHAFTAVTARWTRAQQVVILWPPWVLETLEE